MIEFAYIILLITIIISFVAFISVFHCYRKENISALLLLSIAFIFLGFAYLTDFWARACGDLALAVIFFHLNIISMPLCYLFLMSFITMTREYKPSLRFYLYLILTGVFEAFRIIGTFNVFFVNGFIHRSEIMYSIALLGVSVNILMVLVVVTTIWVFLEMVHLIISQLRVAVSKVKRNFLQFNLIALFIMFMPIVLPYETNSPETGVVFGTIMLFFNAIGIVIIALTYILHPYLIYLLPQRFHAVLVVTKAGIPCYTHIIDEEITDDLIILSGFFSAIHELGRIITGSGSLEVIQFENFSVVFSISRDYIAALLISHVLPAHIDIAKQMVETLDGIDIPTSNVMPVNVRKQLFESQIRPLIEPFLP
ncbi:MAG: hypothetical protein ACFFDI_03730 [Promethearchaeota archaeon]